jgi:hypothetical protein
LIILGSCCSNGKPPNIPGYRIREEEMLLGRGDSRGRAYLEEVGRPIQ